MRLTLDWAVFASAPGQGHGLRQTNLPRSEVPSELSNFSDLPGGSEGATDWVPYLSGRAFGETFAFTYTQPDTSAGRAGRVETRVLLVPCAVAEQINDLRPLFGVLKTHPGFLAGRGAINLEFTDAPVPCDEYVKLILGTFASHLEKRAVVVGQEQAEHAIPRLWSAMWPKARGGFSFRLHFDPYELPLSKESPPLLVVTPTGRQRWFGEPSCVVVGAEAVDQNPLIDYLCGTHWSTAHELMKAIDTADVRQLARINNFILDLEEARAKTLVTPLAATLALLDVVAVMPIYKDQVRRELHRQLLLRLDGATGNDVRRLAGVVISDERIQSKVTTWAQGLLDDPTARAVIMALEHGQPWFRNAVEAGLKQSSPSAKRAERVWTFWSLLAAENLLTALTHPAWDEFLVATVPVHAPADAREAAVRLNWWGLATILLGRQGDFAQALQEMLVVVPDTFAPQALVLLRERWGNEQFVGAVIRASDSRTYEEGSRALVLAPELLADLDLKRDPWLRIWARALTRLSDIWAGVPDPGKQVSALLDRLMMKHDIPEGVLEAVSETGPAAVVDYPERRAIWNLVPSGFLTRTARALLARGSDPGDLEETLLSEVLSLLGEIAPSSILARRLLLQTRASLPERKLRHVLTAIGDSLEPEHWQQLETQLMNQPDLLSKLFDHGLTNEPRLPKAFLQHFRSWLSPLRQVRLEDHWGHHADRDIWWQAVHELMTEIYPEGPHVVWERIGGKRKHLVHGDTGEHRWWEALMHIRARAKPKVGDLLFQAGQDFPQSDATSVLWKQV